MNLGIKKINIDTEWVKLIKEAQSLGLTKEEIRIFLSDRQQRSVCSQSSVMCRITHLFYDIIPKERRCVQVIGEKIKALRQEKKLSISELAEQAGIAKSYLSSIERHIQSNPSIQVIEKICDVLGVSVNQLMAEKEYSTDELDDEWLEIVREAMNSGVSKERFIDYLEYNKWRNKQED